MKIVMNSKIKVSDSHFLLQITCLVNDIYLILVEWFFLLEKVEIALA